jgi:uncharacterized ferritin-like protein (DUF455 family)
MSSLRHHALTALRQSDPLTKVALTNTLQSLAAPVGNDFVIDEPDGLPGRPEHPILVPHNLIKQYSLVTDQGKAALVHSVAHIEFNAIDLALDIVWRYRGMPDQFYRDWMRVAAEEALHFSLLRDHLVSLGYDYGSFPAHNALWMMAEKTKGDILARIGLVPRTLEARGLDVSPAVKEKLIGAGDLKAAAIFDIILKDEIGHVLTGNYWYRWICAERGLDPVTTYEGLVERYDPPKIRAPYNIEARRLAGFSEEEIAALLDSGR